MSIIVIAGGGYYCCCYYCAAGRPHCFTTQTEWEVNLQPGRVFQARAKAEKQSMRVGGTEMTPSILGSSFSEKRNEPLGFYSSPLGTGTVLRLGFPICQGDVNMLILAMGTLTLGHHRMESVSAPPAYTAGGSCSDMGLGNEIRPWMAIQGAGSVVWDWVFVRLLADSRKWC